MTADDLRRELLQDPNVRRAWEESAPRRRLGLALAELRQSAGLSQQALAERTGWDQAHVARMESASGPWPRPETVRIFAEACGATAGYVFARPDGGKVRIHRLVAFGNADADYLLDRIAEVDIGVTEPAAVER